VEARDWDNDRWARALAEHFFSDDFAGEPVTFAVDPDCLTAITGESSDAAIENLSRTVRTLVMPGHRFVRVLQLARNWQRDGCDGPPPSLPLLALTVLAVSTNEQFGLYKPFRRLLDSKDGDEGMPPGYNDAVPELWEQLRWWLEVHLEGRRGLPTITKHDVYVNIGYSTQQALLRTADRPLLYRFFRSIGLTPGAEQIVPSELRRALAIWSRRRLPRADRLYRLATDANLQRYVDALLQTLASRWDGRLRDPTTGSRAVPLRLMLQVRPVALSFVARRRAEDPGALDLDDLTGGRLHLTSGGPYFEPFPLPIAVSQRVLRDGIELAGPELSFFHEPALAIPFAYDDDLLEWVSTDRIAFDEKHHLLVHRDIRDATVDWLAASNIDGRLDPAATRHLPEGWFLIRDLRIGPRSETAPRDVQDLLGSGGGGERVRLVGGLKVRSLDHAYLTGGTPNVALPRSLEMPIFSIEKEGFDPIERSADGPEFEMARFDLAPGDYRVVHADVAFPFTILEAFRDVPPPDVGSVRTGMEGGNAAGLLASPSTHVPRPSALPALAPAAMVVLGPDPGDQASVSVPLWVESFAGGPLSWVSLDFWVDFEPVWLLVRATEHTAASYVAHPHGAAHPRAGNADERWARLVVQAELVDGALEYVADLWREYEELAAEILA